MKYKRNERIGAITYILSNNPNRIFTYNYFTERLDVAKTTISEDIVIIKEVVRKMEIGEVITISGASGGVKYIPDINKREKTKFLMNLSKELSNPKRIVSQEFIFMTDIIYSPEKVDTIGRIFGGIFSEKKLDYVVTVETKGIPMAYATAKALNIPLVVVRKNIKITEGTTVSINYVSKSSKSIQSLSLAKNSMIENSNVLVIDDFMREGGTIEGLKTIMKEFNSKVVGVGVLINNNMKETSRQKDVVSLLNLEEMSLEKQLLIITPNILEQL